MSIILWKHSPAQLPRKYMRSGGGSLELRTAIEGSFSEWGGLGKLDRGLGRGETFFPDSGSDRNSDETFQISRKLGLVEFFCLLDSQPWTYTTQQAALLTIHWQP